MFQSVCEVLGVAVGSLAGSIASYRVKMDIIGVTVCGTVAALGGGTLRDIILNLPVFWTVQGNEYFLVVAVISSLATFFISQKYPAPLGTIRIADALVLALFGMIGTERALTHGHGPLIALVMGTTTGVAGGLMRDLLSGNVPYIFRPGELYAAAVMIGSASYLGLHALQYAPNTCLIVGIIVCATVRLAAIRWHWHLPSYRPAPFIELPQKNDETDQT